MASFKTNLKNIVKKFFFALEKRLPIFVSVHTRPKLAERVNLPLAKFINLTKIAIVIQGPIIQDENFTLETVKLYKKIFPESILIVSTWQNSPARVVSVIKQAGAEVLLNQEPKLKGQQNINYQIVSSRAGLNEAKKFGAGFALKTRTDQRIYNPDALMHFIALTNQFAVRNSSVQRRRIIGTSLNTFTYRQYGLSDMTLFGQIDDLLLYWSAGLDDREGYAGEYPKDKGFAKLKLDLCEVYLATEFLAKVGHRVVWSLKDSWQAFADHFCVADSSGIDLFWYKYGRLREYRYRQYAQFQNDEELLFGKWLTFYNYLSGLVIPNQSSIVQVIK